ncbi:hypothetical protein BV25DRAFT_1807912 [Artomyces pyxidatus]|uniref:Uncharacterized protein n=1 Tax=Artomyces pyxidatus TaxID=48021 RepID=A0ACB8SU50_9AGAM|nr:hypothetical protein BV25DRAFT_1807912 [Artomyces pyxidatus]
MSQSRFAQQLRTIASEWPKDPLRPTLQLKTFLTSLAEHPNLGPRTVAATRALHKNRLAKKFPLPESVLQPASMPLHYARLKEGYEKSLQGIGRPWWKVFFGIW